MRLSELNSNSACALKQLYFTPVGRLRTAGSAIARRRRMDNQMYLDSTIPDHHNALNYN